MGKYQPIPRFNDHGSGCKGHSNWLLDCTYEEQHERDLLNTIIESYIGNYER